MVSESESYDVVVIGAGMGGISVAALLAKEGKRVLVLEQAEAPGGYLHAFKRGPYTWDPAVHVFPDGHEHGLPVALLEYLGVRDRVRFIPFERTYSAVFPDMSIEAPFGMEAFADYHGELFPKHAGAIASFIDLCRKVHWQAHHLPPSVGLKDLGAVRDQNPELFTYTKATLQEVLDEHFDDPQVKGVLSALWPYPGAPPSRLSFVTFATTLSVNLDGAFYCEGSFQSLVDAFVAALRSNGGELALNALAEEIVVEEGRVTCVKLAGGEEVRADAVVSAVDAKRTFEQMVGLDNLPSGFVKRHMRMKPSLSAALLFMGTSLDLAGGDHAHEVFHYRDYDQGHVWEDIRAGRPGGTWASAPSMLDPRLAPEGEHALILTSMAAYDVGRPWEEHIDEFADQLVSDFERVFPGLRDSITFQEAATPLTMERFCLNSGGAAYAWENTPAQTGGKRSPHVTPIEGLYLSGHWTQPGSGSLRAMVSGVHTALLILSAAGQPGIGLEHPELPPSV